MWQDVIPTQFEDKNSKRSLNELYIIQFPWVEPIQIHICYVQHIKTYHPTKSYERVWFLHASKYCVVNTVCSVKTQ